MTSTISLPSGGLITSDFPIDLSRRKNKLSQAIEVISIDGESLEKIISDIRNGVEATVSLGKKPAFFLDKKVIPIKTTYQQQGLLFKRVDDSRSLQLRASLNLKDATAKAKLAQSREIDMNDPAILALQASMAQVKEQKDANQTIVVNSSKLPKSKNGRSILEPLKNHRQGMFTGGRSNVSGSTPGSPAMGSVTPQPARRDAKSIKQEALKRSFIHLLAVRAVSEKYMASVLHATPADRAPLLEKYGKKTIDGSKYNLTDRGYKELDPWAFPYKEESDRNGVIERAITAFDRMRLSVTEPLWQKLLKKEERGKGKILSKLPNLHQGPVDRVKTPKIQVDSTTTEDNSNNADRGRHLAPSDAAVRSKSQESVKRAPSTASKAKSSNDKTADMAQTRAQKIAESKPKDPVKKVESKKSTPKKAAGKASNTSGKVKSAEFIEDSDEEIESDEIAAQVSQQKNKRKAEEDLSPPSKKPDIKKTTPKPVAKPIVEKVVSKTKPTPLKNETITKKPVENGTKKSSSSQPEATTSNKKRVPESQRPVSMARSISAKKGNSPVKPSPLGSSPPTNASDFEHEKANKTASIKSSSSSSSGSPLINQRRERLQQEAKRNASNTPPNLNSDRNLKRRANDLENGNHPHGGFSTQGTSSSSSDQPSKRQRIPESSPSTSDSEPRSNASSNTSPSVVLSPADLEYARSFKLQWQKYTTGLRELQALSDPPPERIEKLQKLYAKLVAHKAEICSWDKKEAS